MDDSGYSDNPAILYGANDPYNNIVSYGFSDIRFKNRGYNSETQDVLLAGIRLNDAITGYSPYSLWSGLNEAMRSKEVTNGLENHSVWTGGYNGVTNILGNPSSVRPGWRFSILSNSALYRLRLMANYASGMLDNGWSYAFTFLPVWEETTGYRVSITVRSPTMQEPRKSSMTGTLSPSSLSRHREKEVPRMLPRRRSMT